MFYSATLRILHPAPIQPDFMLYTSLFGLCCNIASALVLQTDDSKEEPEANKKEEEKDKPKNIEMAKKLIKEKADKKEKKTKAPKNKTDKNNMLEIPKSVKSEAVTNASMREANENANVKATYIHILGDIIQSVGVVIGSIIIKCQPTWVIVDPIITFVFAAIVATTTIGVIKECVVVLLERVPDDVDIESLKEDMMRVEGTKNINYCHVWALTDGKPVLMAHVEVKDGYKTKSVLKELTVKCRRIGIYHTTIQTLESDNLDREHIDYIDCSNNIV